jgi:succinate dehydrogenase / fumarate reductase cytochrome b subunit
MGIPIQQRSTPGRALQAWFNPIRRSAGFLAFVLMRLTGIGLVVYLIMHLIVLSTLVQGEAAWDSFVALAKQPAFLLLDVVLIAGILIHMLNGLRVSIIGLGFGTDSHKGIFWTLMVVAFLLLAYAAWLVFTK